MAILSLRAVIMNGGLVKEKRMETNKNNKETSDTAIGINITLCHKPEKAMAPHSSALAWKIPWMEVPGGLQSMEFRRVGHD